MTAPVATPLWAPMTGSLVISTRYHLDHPDAAHVLTGTEIRTLHPDGSWAVTLEQEGISVHLTGDAAEPWAEAQRRIEIARMQITYPLYDPNERA